MSSAASSTVTNFLEALIEICIIFLIVFLPLAFGGVSRGAQLILIWACIFIFFLWFARIRITRQEVSIENIFSCLFLAFSAVVAFQLIPLPRFLLNVLSPNSLGCVISVDPAATKMELFKYLSYGLIALVIINSLNRKEQAIHILGAVAVVGFLVACLGIIQRFAWTGMIYWVFSAGDATPFGPFVNKNHFAGFMELAIPITAAFIFIVKQIEARLLFGFMATVMLWALFLSVSKAGILCLFAALIFIFSTAFLRQSFRKHIFYILPVIFLAVVFTFIMTRGYILKGFSGAWTSLLNRMHVYKAVLAMFKDFPLFGVGAGAFGSIFSRYNIFRPELIFTHPESDWLQFLAETGISGFLCIAIFIWVFFKDILYCHFMGKCSCAISAPPKKRPACAGGEQSIEDKEVGLRHSRFVLAVMLAGLTSITSIIFHGIFDINLHIPSNAFLAFIIAAILIAVAHKSFRNTVSNSLD